MYLVIITICATPLHPPPPNSRYPESTFFTFLIEIARREQITSRLCSRHLAHQWRSLRIYSEFLEDIIREENIADYDSDTVVEAGETPEPATSASCKPSRIAPNPFPERSTDQAPTALRASSTLDEPIITNKLDEQQLLYIEENEKARRLF